MTVVVLFLFHGLFLKEFVVIHCPGGTDVEVPGGVGAALVGGGVGVGVGHAASVDVEAYVFCLGGVPFESQAVAGRGVAGIQLVVERNGGTEGLGGLVLLVHALDEDVEAVG